MHRHLNSLPEVKLIKVECESLPGKIVMKLEHFSHKFLMSEAQVKRQEIYIRTVSNSNYVPIICNSSMSHLFLVNSLFYFTNVSMMVCDVMCRSSFLFLLCQQHGFY